MAPFIIGIGIAYILAPLVDLLEEKSKLTRDILELLIESLTENIQIVPGKYYSNKLKKARKTLKNIDLDDAPFLALALSIPNDGLWSKDKELQKQKLVKVWTTKELKSKLDEFRNI